MSDRNKFELWYEDKFGYRPIIQMDTAPRYDSAHTEGAWKTWQEFFKDGYALVPIEPTKAMIDAAETAVNIGEVWTFKGMYKEMIAVVLDES